MTTHDDTTSDGDLPADLAVDSLAQTTEINDLVGRVIDERYRIVSELGVGGMGAVYLAERLQLQRRVAIKFLHAFAAKKQEGRRRFEIEAKALSRLSHPNCVSVIDFGVADVPYLVMEFIAGITLKEILKTAGRLPPKRVIAIASQLLAALAHAHGRGIIHRDIKPANVKLVDYTGTSEQVKVLDFGLAKVDDPTIDQTRSQVLVGTPAYMSPEQTVADRITERSDIYSTAVVLFELMTGRKPFIAHDIKTMLKLHQSAPPPKLSSYLQDTEISPELDQAFTTAMAKDPAARYSSAIAFAEALTATPEATAVTVTKRTASASLGALPVSSPGTPRRGWGLVIFTLFALGAVAAAWWGRKFIHPPVQPSEIPSAKDADTRKDARAERSVPNDAGTRHARDRNVDAAGMVQDAAVAQDAQKAIDAAVPDAAAPDAATIIKRHDAHVAPSTADVPQVPEPSALDKARVLLDKNKYDAAIPLLQGVRKRNPNKGYASMLLGHAYFGKKWWGTAMDMYAEAIRRTPKYRYRDKLINNTISALAGKHGYPKASQLLRKTIRTAAKPYLRRAIKGHRSSLVRSRAAVVIKKL